MHYWASVIRITVNASLGQFKDYGYKFPRELAMELWIKIMGQFLTSIMSLVDSSNLRNRLYEIKEEHEIMWTALSDMERMYRNTPAGDYAEKTLKLIRNKYRK